jgi:hypothetical protein
MSQHTGREIAEVAEALEHAFPGRLRRPKLFALAHTLLTGLEIVGKSGPDGWRWLVDLVTVAVEVIYPDRPRGEHDPYDPPKPDQLTGELLTAFADLGAELGERMPCPPNMYLVGVRGEDLMVAMPVQGRIAKGSALNLAVWLVALADPQLTRFAPMLAKVLQT